MRFLFGEQISLPENKFFVPILASLNLIQNIKNIASGNLLFVSTNGISDAIDKLKEALFAAPGAFSARVLIKQSNFALHRAANYPLARLFLLKHKPSSGKLRDVIELDEHWHVEFLENAGALKISIATLDTNFPDLIAQVSFIAFGLPDGDGDFEVFAIDPDERDKAAPNGANVCWVIICTKDKKERFNAA